MTDQEFEKILNYVLPKMNRGVLMYVCSKDVEGLWTTKRGRRLLVKLYSGEKLDQAAQEELKFFMSERRIRSSIESSGIKHFMN